MMDPDEALKKAREVVQCIRAMSEDSFHYYNTTHPFEAAEDLADAFEALDHWLSIGGFLPKDWDDALHVSRG
jgi:hypothetical protein